MIYIEHGIEEAKGRRIRPLSHVWDDTDEPVACEIDRHVTEIIKHEIKQTFP